MVRTVGVDLSLTATGVATPAGTQVIKSKLSGVERLHAISDAVLELAAAHDPTTGMPLDVHVFVEGYAMGSPRQAGTYAIGELGGVVRYRLWDNGIPWTDVAPAALKKFAAGKGNARKPDMLDASRRAGYEGSNDDNAVDAWWFRQFGLYALGAPEVERYAYRDDATKAVADQLRQVVAS